MDSMCSCWWQQRREKVRRTCEDRQDRGVAVAVVLCTLHGLESTFLCIHDSWVSYRFVVVVFVRGEEQRICALLKHCHVRDKHDLIRTRVRTSTF